MDKYLIDYLRSGKAWVLVGTGPSIQMGYPSWPVLAERAANWVKQEVVDSSTAKLDRVLANKDFPRVFSEITELLGNENRLLQYLQTELRPNTNQSEIYRLITQWPVPVYLTTNWDDEIQRHLTNLGETYLSYGNSPDHMAHLVPDLQGAILKLHGDMRSSSGLIMTHEEYEQIENGPEWQHWRAKMNAVFQMNRVIIIGHSLTDPHIRHVLTAAKTGSGIVQPVVWLAPDANDEQRREFLERHRIRVVSYDNRDGRHTNLLRLLRDVSQFVPPHERVKIQAELVAAIPTGPRSDSAAASALLVYNTVTESDPLEQLRVKLIVAALESAIPDLATRSSFSISDALSLAAWPEDCPLGSDVSTEVGAEAIRQGLVTHANDGLYAVAPGAVERVQAHIQGHNHLRQRFQKAVATRVQRLFPDLTDTRQLAQDIDDSLIGCFQSDGFVMAASALSNTLNPTRNLPTRILEFLNGASTQYPDLLHRQAFTSTVIDLLTNPTSADTQYLGALIGGYCALNYLGVFGDVAIERLNHARETVWLLDSDAQIPALALGAPMYLVFTSCLSRLQAAGVKLFTLHTLFNETLSHYRFARGVIRRQGQASPDVLYAAQGQPPYRKSNQFLEGYIRWQAAGNPADWEGYLQAAFGTRTPSDDDIRDKLEALGVTVIDFQDWPGFVDIMFATRDERTIRITEMRATEPAIVAEESDDAYEDELDASKKAKPEAEAMLVILGERNGSLNILKASSAPSPAWFISHTSILNKLSESDTRITWWPESFLRFTESLANRSGDTDRAERLFQTLLWTFAQTGTSLLDRRTVEIVFGSVGEQCEVQINEQRDRYAKVLSTKYGATPEQLLNAVRKEDRPLAAVQMAFEVAQREASRADALATQNLELAKKTKAAEGELEKLDRYKKKLSEREEKRKRNRRQNKSGKKRR